MRSPAFFLRRSASLVAVVFALMAGPAVVAEETDLMVASDQPAYSEESAAAAAQAAGDVYKNEKAGFVVPSSHGCTQTGTLSCNQTIGGTITNHGCVTTSGSTFFNFYRFSATAGQRITLTVRSSVIDPLIILFDGQDREIGRDDDGGGGLDSLLAADVTQTGQFTVAVYAMTTVRPATGSFTISLTCSAPPSGCSANSTTLCLSNGRFRVQTRWATSNGQSGDGQAVPITGDTGYFWFFNSANVEMVLKVLDACPSRYWVFAGGLTNVQVTMTVTDTKTGTVKTYNNPQGQAFQPIQDTNAFATCP